VPLDPHVRALTATLCAAAEQLFTKTGRAKANGPLDLAEQKCARLELELEQIGTRRTETEALQHEHARLTGEVAALRTEQQQAQEEAIRARAEAEAAEKLQTALVGLETAFKHSDDALQQVKRDEEALAMLTRTIAATKAEQQERTGLAERAAASLPAAQGALERAESEAREHARARAAQQERRDRVQGLLRIRQVRQEAVELRGREESASAKAAELQALGERLAQFPAITEKQLQSWRALENSIRESTAQLDALRAARRAFSQRARRSASCS
jgi:chromosome segregation ATPase